MSLIMVYDHDNHCAYFENIFHTFCRVGRCRRELAIATRGKCRHLITAINIIFDAQSCDTLRRRARAA